MALAALVGELRNKPCGYLDEAGEARQDVREEIADELDSIVKGVV
jgi:hypothetical protein